MNYLAFTKLVTLLPTLPIGGGGGGTDILGIAPSPNKGGTGLGGRFGRGVTNGGCGKKFGIPGENCGPWKAGGMPNPGGGTETQ